MKSRKLKIKNFLHFCGFDVAIDTKVHFQLSFLFIFFCSSSSLSSFFVVLFSIDRSIHTFQSWGFHGINVRREENECEVYALNSVRLLTCINAGDKRNTISRVQHHVVWNYIRVHMRVSKNPYSL